MGCAMRGPYWSPRGGQPPPPPPSRSHRFPVPWPGPFVAIGTNGTRHNQHIPGTPTTGLRERGSDTSRSTGRSGRQNAATRRNMRREERVTVQGPVKKQQPNGMSHRGLDPPTPKA